MLATKFKWQEEKEGGEPPWLYDGSSSMRQVPAGTGRRGPARHWKKLVALLFLVAVFYAVARFEYEESFRASGIIEPYRVSREHIKAPISGTIRELSAHEGEIVSEGELLAVIWPDELDVLRDVENRKLDYEIALEEINKARETIAILETRIERLGKELSMLRDDRAPVAVLERKTAAAEREHRFRSSEWSRAQALYEQGVISASEHDRFQNRWELASEEVLALQEEIRALLNDRAIREEQLEREIELSRRQTVVERIHLEQRKKEMEQQETMLEAARRRAAQMDIFAPWSGTVVRQEKSAGDRVSSGESIVILSADRGKQVSIRVRPEDYPRLKVDQEALVFPRSSSREAIAGHVSAIGSYARRDAESGGHYIPAWIIVTGEAGRPLPLGTLADVTIRTGRKTTLLSRDRYPSE